MINFLIIHYNTYKLTSALVSNINKIVPGSKIYIFENSPKKYDWGVSNVTVFDNSKGQIVNFDSELEKYPNRKKSLGRCSNFGSFKHCISVDRCFDLLHEPFILLDSDVLLKKDPSDLVSEDVYWSGEVFDWSWKLGDKNWPQGKRIDPRISFINLTKCKSDGIRYFEEHHMAGLWNPDKEADSFDTGGWFYEQVKDLDHINIKRDDYVVHFGGGSHLKSKSQEEFLAKNRKLFTSMEIKAKYSIHGNKSDHPVLKKKYTNTEYASEKRSASIDYLFREW